MAVRSAKREPVTRNLRSRTPRTAASVRKQSVSDVIARSLEEDIVLGRRHPREHLVEQDLCERFNTHRGDVRLALFELEKKGIIRRIPNRGAIVRDLTPDDSLLLQFEQRSEEHTSELQSRQYLVCRLL